MEWGLMTPCIKEEKGLSKDAMLPVPVALKVSLYAARMSDDRAIKITKVSLVKFIARAL